MKHGQSYFHVALAVVLVGFSLTANAIIKVPQLASSATVEFSFPSSTACTHFSNVGTTVTCSGNTAIPGTGATLDYSTTAFASYKTLKAAGKSTISNVTPSGSGPYASLSYGEAFWTDQFVITGSSGLGRAWLTYDIKGTYDISAVDSGAVLDFFLVNLDTHELSSPILDGRLVLSTDPGTQTLAETVKLSTDFVFGRPFDILVDLKAGSSLLELESGGVDGLSAFLDIHNTATLVAITVEDAKGHMVPFNLLTASGASIFSELAPGFVPEPPTTALFGLALAGLLFSRRKQA